LALLGARVFTIERQEELYIKTKDLLKQLKFSAIRCFFRDGSAGLAEFAPFDRIIVTAAAPSVSEVLKSQLAVGGILVAPIGDAAGQTMVQVKKLSDTEFEEKALERFRFVPFLSGVNRK
jgi:protein-L-isoaspartate(D-aspartate) O-methyltransferase